MSGEVDCSKPLDRAGQAQKLIGVIDALLTQWASLNLHSFDSAFFLRQWPKLHALYEQATVLALGLGFVSPVTVRVHEIPATRTRVPGNGQVAYLVTSPRVEQDVTSVAATWEQEVKGWRVAAEVALAEEQKRSAAEQPAAPARELVAHAEALLRAQGPARDQGEQLGNGKPPKTPQVAESTKEYDAFLCHASEDKVAVVRPFADLMREHRLKPWLDEREINWGHNLAKKIQAGLARSRFVVVFLSSAFLSKKGWTDKELNTALSMDDGEDPLVLPVVLGITHEELEAKYPLVSAKLYREIPDYDPAKQVPPGELTKLVEELKNMIGVSDRRPGRGRP